MYNPRDLDSQRDPMLSTSKPLVASLLAFAALLSGCAAESVLVNHYDIQRLQDSVATEYRSPQNLPTVSMTSDVHLLTSANTGSSTTV